MKFFLLIFVSVFAFSISTLAQGVIFDENDSVFFNSKLSEIPVSRSIAPSKASLSIIYHIHGLLIKAQVVLQTFSSCCKNYFICKK